MARSYAPLLTSIWQDAAFTSLPAGTQRVYLMVISQPDMTYCGVAAYTPQRWAHFASDTKPGQVARAVGDLEGSGYLLVDPDTQEVFVRSFIKHNAPHKHPNTRKAMERAFDEIHSPALRAAVLASLPADYEGPLRGPDGNGSASGRERSRSVDADPPPPSTPRRPVGVEVEGKGVVGFSPDSRETVDERIDAVVRIVAEHEADSGRYRIHTSREGYIRSRLAPLRREHEARVRHILLETSVGSVEEVARYVLGEKPLAVVRPPCPLCLEHVGVVELDDGTFTDCECKQARSA